MSCPTPIWRGRRLGGHMLLDLLSVYEPAKAFEIPIVLIALRRDKSFGTHGVITTVQMLWIEG